MSNSTISLPSATLSTSLFSAGPSSGQNANHAVRFPAKKPVHPLTGADRAARSRYITLKRLHAQGLERLLNEHSGNDAGVEPNPLEQSLDTHATEDQAPLAWPQFQYVADTIGAWRAPGARSLTRVDTAPQSDARVSGPGTETCSVDGVDGVSAAPSTVAELRTKLGRDFRIRTSASLDAKDAKLVDTLFVISELDHDFDSHQRAAVRLLVGPDDFLLIETDEERPDQAWCYGLPQDYFRKGGCIGIDTTPERAELRGFYERYMASLRELMIAIDSLGPQSQRAGKDAINRADQRTLEEWQAEFANAIKMNVIPKAVLKNMETMKLEDLQRECLLLGKQYGQAQRDTALAREKGMLENVSRYRRPGQNTVLVWGGTHHLNQKKTLLSRPDNVVLLSEKRSN